LITTGSILASAVICVVLAILSGHLNLKPQCEARDTQIPTVPVYPNSILVAEQFAFDDPTFAEYRYTYETSDPLPSVSEYYEERGSCFTPTSCGGEASPFGVYDVDLEASGDEGNPYITPAPPSSVQFEGNENISTHIYISVRWDRCSPGWRDGSVED
jgi:hypothetical protein